MSESLDRQSTSLTPKTKLEAALAKRTQAQQVILVLDTSGSMSEQADTPGERRIDALRGVVENLRLQSVPFKQLCFSDSPFWSDIVPEPMGGTNLSGALEFCKQAAPQHVIIVSDGWPNSRDAALAVAKQLNCRVDVYYVGPSSDTNALAFMKSLANSTGGVSGAVSFKELAIKIAGALTAGSQTEETHKPIAL